MQVVNGYFVHFFAPSDMEEIPKDVLMILDVSGSMSGTKLKQMKKAVLSILSDLHDGDRFNILQFSDRVYYYKDSPVLANLVSVAEAKAYVKKMKTIGGKNSARKLCNDKHYSYQQVIKRDYIPMILNFSVFFPFLSRVCLCEVIYHPNVCNQVISYRSCYSHIQTPFLQIALCS